MTESSNYDGAPPVPPAYGVLAQDGPRRIRTEIRVLLDRHLRRSRPSSRAQAGCLPAAAVFTETIKLAADGQSFTSTMRHEAFDAKGNPADGGTAQRPGRPHRFLTRPYFS
mgnify:CR=1 FL=1